MSQAFTPVILTHLVAALAALVLGAWVLGRRKGTALHRTLGRVWVGLMLVTAISSFWIRGSGSFSWIHGLSVFTLCALGGAIWFARTGRIAHHRKTMIGIYAGGLVVAGLFTLLPQRLLGRLVWGALGLA
jgi:uncharacterized membrane protein